MLLYPLSGWERAVSLQFRGKARSYAGLILMPPRRIHVLVFTT